MCGPEHAGPYKWNKDGLELRKRNAEVYMERHKDFYANLEKSILAEGIKNPILVNAGHISPRKERMLPPDMRDEPSKILYCHNNGGSRLHFAKKYDIEVKCIVSDFIGRFDGCPEIRSEEELQSYYVDTPTNPQCREFGLTIKGIRKGK